MAEDLSTPALARSRLALLLFGTVLLLQGCLQIEIRERVLYRWNTARSGLLLREGPGLQYARILTIPFGSKVRVEGIVSRETPLDGRIGRWTLIVYQGMSGYAYDAFLAEVPPPAKEEREIPSGKTASRPAGQGDKSTPILKSSIRTPQKSPPPAEAPPEAVSKAEARQKAPTSPEIVAYLHHDSPDLIKLSRKEFEEISAAMKNRFSDSRSAFGDLAGDRRPNEPLEDYLRRAEEAKRLWLMEMRRVELADARKVYSIYDARLEKGNYHPGIERFAWLGTSVPCPSDDKVITLPDKEGLHAFANGRKLNVKIPAETAAEIELFQEDLRVRIDFSYTESLQDLFEWSWNAYFLPRRLVLYHPETGRIFYECRLRPRVERAGDPALPLRVDSRFVEERVD